MGSSWPSRLRASVFGTPVYIALVGLVLTALIAVLQESNQRSERQLLFDTEVERIEHAIDDAVENQGVSFASSVSFNAATHPASLSDYRTFFGREFDLMNDLDPGVMLIEAVKVDDIPALQARERALNRETFTVFSPFPTASDERMIITRTGRDMRVFDFPLLGLDVTAMGPLIIETELPDSGFALRIVEPDPVLGMLSGEELQTEPVQAGVSPAMVTLLASLDTPDGEFVGYTTRFMSVEELLEPVREMVAPEMHVELLVEGIDGPIARFGGDRSDIGSPSFSTSVSARTASLEWQVNVFASGEFGNSLGLVEQTNVWVLGLPLSLIASLMVVVSDYHRRRMDEAAFEVEHALALASTDPLTGLLNRQGMIDSARGVDEDQPAALFFVDLDGFKVVNDVDGHDEGDRVLREVARRLRDICRPEDFVCRLGGDEFVVFTPGNGSADHMADVSSRITLGVAAIDPRVTGSVGVAARGPGDATDVKELLRTADQAMYEAKRAGGDRFAVSDPTT